MISIPQSTAYTHVFKAYLASDHVTEATGKTVAITISKNAGAFANPSAGATNATEISNGWYSVALSTTDTGTLGWIAIKGTAATIDDMGDRVFVVKATNGGWTALPDTAVTTNASLLTSGTGTAQVSVASGQVTVATNNDKTGYTASTVSDKTGYALTSAYDLAKTAAQTGDVMKVSSGTGANQISLASGLVTVGTNSDKTGYTVSTVSDKTGYALTTAYDPAKTASQAGDAMTLTIAYNAAKTAAQAGDAMTLTVAYDAAKTAAQAGNAMTLTGAYDAAKTAAQAGNAMTLTSGERNSVADAMLDRDMSTGTDSGSTTVRTVRQALRFLRNKWAVVAGVVTVYKEDDSTASWTASLSTDAAAVPVIGSDPAGP